MVISWAMAVDSPYQECVRTHKQTSNSFPGTNRTRKTTVAFQVASGTSKSNTGTCNRQRTNRLLAKAVAIASEQSKGTDKTNTMPLPILC